MPTVISPRPSGVEERPWGIGTEEGSVLFGTSSQIEERQDESSWDEWSGSGEAEKTQSLVSEIVVVLDRLRRRGILLDQRGEIGGFLLRFPDLIEVVDKVGSFVWEHLPEAQLRLRVYHDPESEEEYLVLYARFPAYDDKTLERIRRVRREYRAFLAGKSGWLLLTTDFRKPE